MVQSDDYTHYTDAYAFNRAINLFHVLDDGSKKRIFKMNKLELYQVIGILLKDKAKNGW